MYTGKYSPRYIFAPITLVIGQIPPMSQIKLPLRNQKFKTKQQRNCLHVLKGENYSGRKKSIK